MDQSQTSLGKHSTTELTQYLNRLYKDVNFTVTNDEAAADIVLLLSKQAKDLGFKQIPSVKESYRIIKKRKKLYIISPDENGLLSATYGLLEHLGCGFYISGDACIQEKEWKGFKTWEIADNPLAKDRIVFTWHNFLSGCTGWNIEDWKSWVQQARKMRYNTIMIHGYGNNPMFSFKYKGEKKETGYFCNSVSGRDWGNEHVNDVRRLPGGKLFPSAIYGAEVTLDKENREKNTIKMMQEVFRYAEEIGLKSIFAYDFDTWMGTPQNIVKKLPETDLFKINGYLVPNPETTEGYNYYKAQIKALLKLYPQIDQLSVCHRIPGDGFGSIWMNFPETQFPSHWKQEYKEILKQHPEITPSIKTSSMYAYGKLLKCFLKIKEEIKPDLEISSFSWRFHYVPLADIFFPKEISLLPLDWEIVLDQPESKKVLKEAAQHRIVNPVVWAHHDDHRYMGRCYQPWKNFSSLLKDIDSKGFGVIHWTTRPLDMYFINTIHQVWQKSENESLKQTLSDYSLINFAPENLELMSSYLTKWIYEGPMFGRETGDHFIDLGKGPAGDKENTWQVMKELSMQRTQILKQYKEVPKNLVYPYALKMEEFYQLFADNQILFNEAYTALEKGDTAKAIRTIEKTSPEVAIEKYAEAIQAMPPTSGEKGILFSMGLRWYPDFMNLKQRLGIMPVHFRFQTTQHDQLAALPGHHTYYIDEQNQWWKCMWEHEMKNSSFEMNKSSCTWNIKEKEELPLLTMHYNSIAPGYYRYTIQLSEPIKPTNIKLLVMNNGRKRIIPSTNISITDQTLSLQTQFNRDDKMFLKAKSPVKIKSIYYEKLK